MGNLLGVALAFVTAVSFALSTITARVGLKQIPAFLGASISVFISAIIFLGIYFTATG
ncbi:MAG: hypothetical protein ACE5JP_06695 [Candidatus Bipolaricaulia bacterium]